MTSHRIGWAGRLLPPARDHAMRFLPWVLALMVYVAGLAGIGLIVLHGTLRAADRSLDTALTVQVPANTSSLRLATIMAVLRRTKGIVSAHLFEAAETARLIKPWLGPAVPLDELPVPRLIDVRTDPVTPPELATLRRQLKSVLPEARLDDHRGSLAAAHGVARRVEMLLAGAIAVALLLIGAAATFAIRTALLVQRSEFEVLHLLGASDAAIAGQVALRYLGLGLVGGAVGAAAALLSVALLGQGGALIQLPAPAAAKGVGDWRFWAVLLAAAAAAGVIPLVSAQLTLRRWLARMP